jgi:hypothetical protein
MRSRRRRMVCMRNSDHDYLCRRPGMMIWIRAAKTWDFLISPPFFVGRLGETTL